MNHEARKKLSCSIDVLTFVTTKTKTPLLRLQYTSILLQPLQLFLTFSSFFFLERTLNFEEREIEDVNDNDNDKR